LPPPLIDKAGNIRLDKLNRPEDIDQVIRDSATRNDNYIRERRGVISEGAGTGPACLVAFTPFMWTGSGMDVGKKPKKAEPKQRNSESVHQYAVGSGLPGIASNFRVDVHDLRSRHLDSLRMIDPFANTKRQEPQPDQNGGDELLQTGGDGDQATSEGHNVPPADGLRFIQVHSDQQLTFDIAPQAKRCRKWGR
jgi:hypothetical protein